MGIKKCKALGGGGDFGVVLLKCQIDPFFPPQSKKETEIIVVVLSEGQENCCFASGGAASTNAGGKGKKQCQLMFLQLWKPTPPR